MRFKIAAVMVLACLPMAAQAQMTGPLAAQGQAATVRGTAHIQRGAEGTLILLDTPNQALSVAGFVAFGDEFPGLNALEGRDVELTGVVVRDGRAIIIVTNPEQLRLAG